MLNTRNVPVGETSEEQNKNTAADRLRKATVAGALGIVSIAGFVGQRKGIIQDFSQPTRSIAESCSHPALGYLGAWLSTSILSRFSDRFKVTSAVVGASAANFATEAMQSTLLNSHLGDYNFLAEVNQHETAKDYLAALMGMGLFLLLDSNPTEDGPTPES